MPRATAALAALLLAVALQVAAGQSTSQAQGIIRVSNGRFVDDSCTEYRFAGWNGWNLLRHAVQDPAYITQKFQQAQDNSLNVVRFFLAGGDDDGAPLLLSGPGQFNEQVARGLDFLLAEAAKYGVKATIAFLNLWKPAGVPQFEQWCGTSGTTVRPRPDIDVRPPGALNATERLTTPYAWLTSPACRDQVKSFYSAVVNRRNTLTGVLYRDDPTIFSWNLMNEPRCKYCGPEPVDGWYGDMAAYLKSIDPNHLVTTGEEGFFEEADPAAASNPTDGNVWASRSGQSFRANHQKSGIDYAVMHLWPDNWRNPPLDVAWGQQWIDAHIQVASQLGLPLVLEEFGKNAAEQSIGSVRDPWFELVNAAVDSSLASGGPLRGSLFWQWDGDSGPRPGNGSDIRLQDSTFTQHIRPFAAKLAATLPDTVPGCVPRTSPVAGPVALAAGAPGAVPAAEGRTQAARLVPSPSPSSPSSTSSPRPSPSPSPSSPSPSRSPPSVKLFEGPSASGGAGRKLLNG
ncbi:hypothetical protein ABPG75_008072 [Micractinium tetrahymenae]